MLLSSCMLAGAAAPTDPRAAAAGQLVDLFADTCLVNSGDVRLLRSAITARGLTSVAAAEARAMLGMPGRAFSTGRQSRRLLALSYDNGQCAVAADDAEPVIFLLDLSKLLAGRGFKVAEIGHPPGSTATGYMASGHHVRLTILVKDDQFGTLNQASILATPITAWKG